MSEEKAIQTLTTMHVSYHCQIHTALVWGIVYSLTGIPEPPLR